MLAANQLLNKILQTKDYEVIKTNGLEANYFGGYENEFNFITDHYKKYGNVPDVVTFLQKFNNFELTEVNETNDYLIDKLYEEYGYTQFSNAMPILATKLKEDSRVAYQYLLDTMPNLKPHTVCKGVDIIADAYERYDIYKNRANAPEKAVIKTGLTELDEIFGGWEFGDELVTIVARTNQGKCFSKGTLIRMADGTCKKVEDIKIGDKVQSYNCVNTVTQLHNGKSKGYKIVPKKGGDCFTVTDDHILTLWCRNQIWDKDLKRTVTDGTGTLIDLTVEEFLDKPKSFKNNCMLFRPAINYDEKELSIPPYIMGVILSKSEDLEYLVKNYYQQDNQILSQTSFVGDLSQGKLLDHKDVPLEYLTSKKQQRLELLAGLLDGIGYYNKRCNQYELQITDLLKDSVLQLCRGLGYKVLCKQNKQGYKLTFIGNLREIPCRVFYKKCTKESSNKNPLLSGFSIERIDEEFEYFGFACDGDHRFLLQDNTLTHNSWMLMKFLTEAWKQGFRVGLYSGEMNHIKLGYRFDALFNHFSNKALVQGFQTDGYEQYIQNMKNIPNPFYIITQKQFGGKPTVQKIRNFVEENKLDIVGIDQFSLMEDGRASMRDPTRMRLSHIAEDLFLLSSEYKIPVLGLAQANREATKKEDVMDAPGIENIKESDDIAHNSSKCLGMRQTNFGLVLDVIKNREGKVGDKLLYAWTIDVGDMSYIPSPDDAARVDTRQQVMQQSKDKFNAATVGVNPF